MATKCSVKKCFLVATETGRCWMHEVEPTEEVNHDDVIKWRKEAAEDVADLRAQADKCRRLIEDDLKALGEVRATIAARMSDLWNAFAESERQLRAVDETIALLQADASAPITT